MGFKEDSTDEYYSRSDASLESESYSLAISNGKERKKNISLVSSRDDEYLIGDEEENVWSCKKSKYVKGSGGKKWKAEGKKIKKNQTLVSSRVDEY